MQTHLTPLSDHPPSSDVELKEVHYRLPAIKLSAEPAEGAALVTGGRFSVISY